MLKKYSDEREFKICIGAARSQITGGRRWPAPGAHDGEKLRTELRFRVRQFRIQRSAGNRKNHLAAAIGNHLLAGGRSVLVVTIPDLMLRVRECYDDGQSEASLLDDLCRVDLLIPDEVGIQRGSSGEKVILNRVIDRRLSSMRPVGILTNLNYESLTDTLGARILDRLQMDGGMWVNFDWDSYRKNVRHLRVVK